MNTQTSQAHRNTTSQLPPYSYVLIAIGGGVVGQDYAQWLTVDPIIGALIGAVISTILTQILYNISRDQGGKIKDTFSKIGALMGAILGGYSFAAPTDGIGWVIGAVIFASIGAYMGRMVAALISLGALFLLFISQGPVGFFIRSLIINAN